MTEKSNFKVTTYGTRGSVPVSRPGTNRYGGNTTCLRVQSDCLPAGMALVIDSGSGYVPLANDLLKEGVKEVVILITHYHHDHTQGLPLAGLTFVKKIPVRLFGPEQNGYGPQEMMSEIMKKPFFPVEYKMYSSHFHCSKFEYPQTKVLLFHPQGGVKMFDVDVFERSQEKDGLVSFRQRRKFPISECMVVRMHSTEHPEQTVSYRFEEQPTGKVFCLLTDHESQDGIPQSLQEHLKGADLLIQDVQYDEEIYQNKTAGYGHGTPKYAVRLALTVGAKRLGFTHHDPMADDEKIDAVLAEGRTYLPEDSALAPDDLFACHDYGEYVL